MTELKRELYLVRGQTMCSHLDWHATYVVMSVWRFDDLVDQMQHGTEYGIH